MTVALEKLVYYEQQVNDRFGTSSADAVPEFMRPENQQECQLAWCRMPVDEAEVFVEQPFEAAAVAADLSREGHILYPVHPLEEDRIDAGNMVYSGHIRFSASYRTVFYRPEPGGPLSTVGEPGHTTMLKLNLEKAIPGIPGDRRLGRDAVLRCVLLGNVLRKELSRHCPASDLRIIAEPIGLFANGAGTLVRPVPDDGIVPLFALYSGDRRNSENRSLLDIEVRRRYGDDNRACARRFGDDIGRPLVRALIDGFRCGFSLEMHAQNTLVSIGESRLIDNVYFRDLEGALVSNELRTELGLEPIPLPGHNVFGGKDDFPLGRFFNRNLDHDIGRVLRGCLRTLSRSGYFGDKDVRIATDSIRQAARDELRSANLPIAAAARRFLPFSRAPWGSGMRPGHWFRTEFR